MPEYFIYKLYNIREPEKVFIGFTTNMHKQKYQHLKRDVKNPNHKNKTLNEYILNNPDY